jgi:LmbE family N-acetylglucosaminyl deacetylase
MAIYAHPDDEILGCGGTLASYAARGVRVVLVCATRGEVGEISDPSLATPETLGEVREQELRCAAETLGIHDVYFLSYRDSGMEGTPENNDSRAFIQADPVEVTSELVGLIRSERPQVVVTFEPYGGYGHPDHRMAHKAAVAAFDAAGDAQQFPEQGEPWQSQRLFYSAIPTSFWLEMRDHMAAAGMDTSRFDNIQSNPERFPDEKITTKVEVSRFVDAKFAAALCHATQFGAESVFRRVPEEVFKHISSREYFAQARPDPLVVSAPAQDLFEGLLA